MGEMEVQTGAASTVGRSEPCAPSRAALLGAGIVTCFVLAVWGFPAVWYTRSARADASAWFGESTNVVGWSYSNIPVSASAERLLVADSTFSGEYTNQSRRQVVRAFSAKRYTHKPHDTGLFLHTPDRCWALAGWKFEPVTPDHVELTVHGTHMVFERRVFVVGGQRELVYFGGLVGGQPLPYRLDHNLSVGLRFAATEVQKGSSRGFLARAVDERLWGRIWDGFTTGSQLRGPKQFIRISTPVFGQDLDPGDRLLGAFLEQWLRPVDYRAELDGWLAKRSS